MPEISGVWVFVLGVATGVIPTGIAFLTYVLRRRTQKTKLTVHTRCSRVLSGGSLESLALGVRIVSHCHFDVTISKIGLRVHKNWYSRQRLPLKLTGPSHQDKPLPYRLDARDEKTFMIPIRKTWWFADGRVPTVETALTATDVYVETSMENRFYGRDDGLKDFLTEVRESDLTKMRNWGK